MPHPRRKSVARHGRRLLAPLRDVGRRAARRNHARPPSKPAAVVEPVFVRMLWGRVGSTLLMQLLGTSPEVAFRRKYPFESRQAASLLAWTHSLRGPLPPAGPNWLLDEHLWWIDPAAFGVQVSGSPLHYGPHGAEREQLRHGVVRGVWQAFSDATRAQFPAARWYAEKYGGFAEDLVDAGVPVRFVDLVRDPRDIWASVRSFDEQRGFFGFGRLSEQSEDEYLQSLATALGRRFAAMRDTPAGVARLVVRYEDLAADLPGQAARIGDWLGAGLDAAAVTGAQDRFRHHMTSANVESSIGRWQRDVSAAHQQLLADALGSVDDFGYDVAGTA